MSTAEYFLCKNCFDKATIDSSGKEVWTAFAFCSKECVESWVKEKGFKKKKGEK